jgi:hypothetical protein
MVALTHLLSIDAGGAVLFLVLKSHCRPLAHPRHSERMRGISLNLKRFLA